MPTVTVSVMSAEATQAARLARQMPAPEQPLQNSAAVASPDGQQELSDGSTGEARPERAGCPLDSDDSSFFSLDLRERVLDSQKLTGSLKPAAAEQAALAAIANGHSLAAEQAALAATVNGRERAVEQAALAAVAGGHGSSRSARARAPSRGRLSAAPATNAADSRQQWAGPRRHGPAEASADGQHLRRGQWGQLLARAWSPCPVRDSSVAAAGDDSRQKRRDSSRGQSPAQRSARAWSPSLLRDDTVMPDGRDEREPLPAQLSRWNTDVTPGRLLDMKPADGSLQRTRSSGGLYS